MIQEWINDFYTQYKELIIKLKIKKVLKESIEIVKSLNKIINNWKNE